MSYLARTRRGNACGAGCAVAEPEPALVRSRDDPLRLLRVEGDEGNFPAQSIFGAVAFAVCVGVRMGEFQLSLPDRGRLCYALLRRHFIRGTERSFGGARSYGRGAGHEVYLCARASLCRACFGQRGVYPGQGLWRRRGGDWSGNAFFVCHAQWQDFFACRCARYFDLARLRALSLIDSI